MKPFAIGFGILLLGFAGFAVPALLKKDPPKTAPPDRSPVVDVSNPAPVSGPVTIVGTGTVKSTRDISLVAEVSGKVVWTSDVFAAGGNFRTGKVLLQLEASDYENAVRVAEASVTQRKYDLIRAKEESEIARQEWDRLQKRAGTTETPATSELGILALKEPQIRLAEAALSSAEAMLSDAKNRLARTRIVAPFDGIVRNKMVDRGQFVSPGQAVASFYGIDAVEISVPLTSSESGLVASSSRQQEQPVATVSANVNGSRYHWTGRVVRSEGVDPTTRTSSVVVRVDRPYSRTFEQPLLVGTFVDVEIAGRAIDQYFQVPREGLRDGSTVWIYDGGNVAIKPVRVLHENNNLVYIDEGLAVSDQVITTNLSVVTEGMKVRLPSTQQ